MCGIFGYIGKEDAVATCIDGLKKLEYRGYDSTGIAGIHEGKLVICKHPGKILELEKKIKQKKLSLTLAIGHTRWATHGEVDEKNAHPHLDGNSTLALIHNGIIENFQKLKEELEAKGLQFHTETDTEVIAQLIASNYFGDLLAAVHQSIKMLKGSFAIALIHKDFPNKIIAAKRESPLVVGFNDEKKEGLLSSDTNAFLGKDLSIYYLQNDEIAVIEKEGIKIYDKNKNEKEPKTEKITGENDFPSKEGFDHYMLKEIFEQPTTIEKAMSGRVSLNFGTANFEGLTFTTTELLAVRHILIIACGTSWHAGCIAASMLEEKARIPTQAEIASEIRFKNPIISNETLIIAISQSGETADTIAAVKETKAKGAKVLGICNVKNSTLAREADSCIYLNAGPEICVCSTKAFTSQITTLSLFSLLMARLRHCSKEEGNIFLQEMKKIPKNIKYVLSNANQIEEIAKKYAQYEDFFFIGRRYMHPTCLEAALKLKEISYLNANGYPAGEMKHGPIALLSKNLPVIAFCSNRQTYDKMLSNLMEVKARKAPILAFAPHGAWEVAKIADDIIWLPATIDELATFPSSVAGQLLAYYIAKIRGADIDQPRNLAKSVTVE